MKIFAPAVIGTGIGVFSLAMMVGSVAIFGPTATPSNGLTVAVDTLQTSVYLLILGWPVAALMGGLSGAVLGLWSTDLGSLASSEPAVPDSRETDHAKQNALATRIARKPRTTRSSGFNQPA